MFIKIFKNFFHSSSYFHQDKIVKRSVIYDYVRPKYRNLAHQSNICMYEKSCHISLACQLFSVIRVVGAIGAQLKVRKLQKQIFLFSFKKMNKFFPDVMAWLHLSPNFFPPGSFSSDIFLPHTVGLQVLLRKVCH